MRCSDGQIHRIGEIRNVTYICRRASLRSVSSLNVREERRGYEGRYVGLLMDIMSKNVCGWR